jgi:hypothetical protein
VAVAGTTAASSTVAVLFASTWPAKPVQVAALIAVVVVAELSSSPPHPRSAVPAVKATTSRRNWGGEELLRCLSEYMLWLLIISPIYFATIEISLS